METKMIIEGIGYLGSALVLVSFLMVSVFKLRVVNSIGSIIFTIYAFIIHSYPTAIMNLCLVMINIYYLVKMSNTQKDYEFVKLENTEALLKYLLNIYKDDIIKLFPGIVLDMNSINSRYIVCHNGKPVGIMLGKREDSTLDIVLDYSIPEYRDFSVGEFLFSKIPSDGIKTMIYRGPDANHKAYLSKLGFVNKDGYYTLEL